MRALKKALGVGDRRLVVAESAVNDSLLLTCRSDWRIDVVRCKTARQAITPGCSPCEPGDINGKVEQDPHVRRAEL
jgi:hypothetical protein